MKKDRAYEIDILKGIGILLVILGHCEPSFPVDLTLDPVVANLHEVIISFHMPLFFFCSGYVLNYATPGSFANFVKSRFIRLIIPYFTFYLLSLFLRILFSSYTRSGLGVGDLQSLLFGFFSGKFYWFLFVLFFVLMLVEIAQRFKHKNWALFFLVFLGMAVYLQEIKLFRLSDIGYFVMYTVVGLSLGKYRLNMCKFLNKKYVPLILVSIFTLLYINTPPPTSILSLKIIQLLYKVSLAWLGIMTFFSISLLVVDSTVQWAKSILNHFGKYSLQYYCVHVLIALPVHYIVAMMHFNIGLVPVFMNFVVFVTISYVLLMISLRIKWLYLYMGIK